MLLGAEGGYQAFELGRAEWAWLVFAAITAVIAILVGIILSRGVLRADTGSDKMREIATAIQEGAMAHRKRQFRTIALIVIPLGIIVFVTSTTVLRSDGSEALGFISSGAARTGA
ncbi:MAG: sodium/proton-translocating pyrophosphatase, partial [Actinomycetota bacterium]